NRREHKERREKHLLCVLGVLCGYPSLRSSLGCRRAISLSRSNIVMAVHIDLDAPPHIVVFRVGGFVAEEILIRELVEQIRERLVQLVDAVGEERAAAR